MTVFPEVGDRVYPTGLREPIAVATVRLDALAARHGLLIETWMEDGLGEAHGVRIRTPSGRVFLLYEMMPIVAQGRLELIMTGSIRDVATFGPAALASEIFEALELEGGLCAWQAPDEIQAIAARMVRQVEAERRPGAVWISEK